MTNKTEAQPEALRLANSITASGQFTPLLTLDSAAAELRRQHAEIEQLKAELSGHKAARMAYANEFPLNEARRQAQTQLADMQEKCSRIGLDIDRALSGQVNEQSPVAGRLRIIAAPKRAPTLTKEQALPIAIKAPSVCAEAGLSVGAHKDITREVADCCGGFCGGKSCS